MAEVIVIFSHTYGKKHIETTTLPYGKIHFNKRRKTLNVHYKLDRRKDRQKEKVKVYEEKNNVKLK